MRRLAAASGPPAGRDEGAGPKEVVHRTSGGKGLSAAWVSVGVAWNPPADPIHSTFKNRMTHAPDVPPKEVSACLAKAPVRDGS